MDIRAILLAAGSGSRFGGGKLLAPLADGVPVGTASWKNLSAAIEETLVVVRSTDTEAGDLFRAAGAKVVKCADAHAGMSHSLIAGLEATAHADGWVIALGDMPFILPETILKVANAIERGALIAMPSYQGTRGHPVGLSNRLLPELLLIRGDEGARDVVRRHAGECELIECEDAGVLRDIDTKDDLA
jgi:molybdenum cofactor cytidylyltransferase